MAAVWPRISKSWFPRGFHFHESIQHVAMCIRRRIRMPTGTSINEIPWGKLPGIDRVRYATPHWDVVDSCVARPWCVLLRGIFRIDRTSLDPDKSACRCNNSLSIVSRERRGRSRGRASGKRLYAIWMATDTQKGHHHCPDRYENCRRDFSGLRPRAARIHPKTSAISMAANRSSSSCLQEVEVDLLLGLSHQLDNRMNASDTQVCRHH